jgi:16S rRNA G966 N2-methylase RsmD
VRALRGNLERLEIAASTRREPGRARVVRTSVPAFLRAANRACERWSLVLCDPPYRLAHRLGPQLAELLPPLLENEARVVCESSNRQPLELPMPLLSRRSYGDTVLVVYAYTGDAG